MHKAFFAAPNIFWWVKPSVSRCNGHAKAANLITKFYTQDGTGVTNKQYRSKEFIPGFSAVFFSLGTALAIKNIGFQFFLVSLLGTIKVRTGGISTCLGPLVGI